MPSTPPPATLDPAETYRAMLRVRRVEESLATAWHDGIVPGEMHTAIGEEALHVGLHAHLADGDAVSMTHRCTPAFVLRGTDLTGLLLDCLGAPEGPSQGMAGHMHLLDPERLISSDGIVGSSAAYGIGFALALQQRAPGKVAVVCHGEGAMNQGMLLESYSLAVAWGLPVLFVCIDNQWSITTRSEEVTGGTPTRRAAGFGLSVADVDGTDPDQVYAAASPLLAQARRGSPAFLHATVFRPAGHFEGDPLQRVLHHPLAQAAALGPGLVKGAMGRGERLGTRARGVKELVGRMSAVGRSSWPPSHPDPVATARARLLTADAQRIDAEVAAEVDAAVAAARAAVAGRTTNGQVVFGTRG